MVEFSAEVKSGVLHDHVLKRSLKGVEALFQQR